MILSDVLGRSVYDDDGRRVGSAVDVRFRLTGNPDGDPRDAVLIGFIVSPKSRTSFLGYERTEVNSPLLIARLMSWLHRGAFLVAWGDVAVIHEDRLVLRPGYRKLDPSLR